MNILILSTHLNTGGITSYIVSLAKGLVQNGHRVDVATSGGDQEAALKEAGAGHIRLDIRTKSELSLKIYRALPLVTKIVRQRKIDVIHAQTRVTQVLAALVCAWTGVPYVTTCHGFFRPKLARRIFPCWGKAVIAISGQVQAHLGDDLGCAKKRIVVVPHGLEARREIWSEERKLAQRKALGLRPGPVIGMVARLSPVKGQDIMIRAMADIVRRFPEANLVLVGDGKEKNALLSLVRDLSLGSHVFFLPVVSRQENIIPFFDVFVMPSRQEGLGLSVMEAQAQGLAVVASDVGGLPTLISHGQTGILVPKEDAGQLARAIIDLLEHPQKRSELGEAAHRFIVQHFPFENMVHQTLDVYRNAIGHE